MDLKKLEQPALEVESSSDHPHSKSIAKHSENLPLDLLELGIRI